jgi:GPH family glycoside/pentoside/hexuronide:cation symporter
MASFGMNQFFTQWITGPFGMYVFFFYETEIGLNVGLAALAFVLFSVWNAINDPLTGFFMERVAMPWEERWGKRFPWVVIGAIPWLFAFLTIFMVPLSLDPETEKWKIFAWLLGSTCLFDTFFTIWTVAVSSMYPDKFKGLNERRTAAGIATIIGITGIVSSSVIPPLMITFGVPETFRSAAWAIIGIGFFIFLTMIPGVREDKKTREQHHKRRLEEKGTQQQPFFETAKMVFMDKIFMTKVTFFFGYQAGVALLSASAPYVVNFVLDMESSALSILMGGMLGGALLSIPIWLRLSKTLNNNKKLSLIAGFAMFFAFLPLIFVNNFYLFIASLFFFGVGLGAQWFADPPTMGDVIDNATVKTGIKQEAVYYGYQAFFIRFGHSVQAGVFAVVHSLTGFVEGTTTRAELLAQSATPGAALFGIRVHTALVPAILVLICTLLFWKYYDLTPEKVAENRAKLEGKQADEVEAAEGYTE